MATSDDTPQLLSREAALESGAKRYFTGVPCSRGHVDERAVRNRTCRACQAISKAAFYRRNRESEKAKVKAYYQANRVQMRHRRNAYDAANPAQKKALFKAWYDANRQAFLASKAQSRLANPEPFKERYKRWATANKAHVLANNRARASRLKGAEGRHAGAEITELLRQQRGLCAYCRAPLKRGYHVDHIVPLAKGGSNWVTNIQLTCRTCNMRKSAKDPIEWAREIGRLL